MPEIDATCGSCGHDYRAPVQGSHRVLCGNSALGHDVWQVVGGEQGATVTITDPPYNVGKDYGAATDDARSAEEYLHWSRAWFALAKRASASCVVITPGLINLPLWQADIERTHKLIAWVKENNNSRNYIGSTSGFQVWEPILVYGKAKKCVLRDAFSIPISIQQDAEGHPCPKPIKLWAKLEEDFSEPGDIIYDPFLGSGTTLIAAAKLGRICFGIEINPCFVDLILDRFVRNFGRHPMRAADGALWREEALSARAA